MKEKISIQNFIKSIAELTLAGSVVDNKIKEIYKKLEKIGNIKIEGVLKTELLIAEIFISHLPLSSFLSERGKTNLLDLYYLEIYKLLVGHYRYFDDRFKLELLKSFEILLRERYKEYYPITKSEENFPKAIAKIFLEKLAQKKSQVSLLMLSGFLIDKFSGVSEFIKETNTKFEIEFDK